MILIRIVLLCLLPLFAGVLEAKTVCIVGWENCDATFFHQNGGPEERHKVFYHLRNKMQEQGFHLTTMEKYGDFKGADTIIAFNYPHDLKLLERMRRAVPRDRLFLYLWEPPVVDPTSFYPEKHQIFQKVFTWNDDLVDNKKYFKFYYPSLRSPAVKSPILFSQRKLCTLIAGYKFFAHPNELYMERLKIIQFFETVSPKDFDFYGYSWPNNVFKTYRGSIDKKIDILKNYKFCIAYENTKDVPGYITEKIFDAFYGGCVPVYWGASNVTDYIPASCFIDRRHFSSDEELFLFMQRMTEEEHQSYLDAIQNYLMSQESQFFTHDFFIRTFINSL